MLRSLAVAIAFALLGVSPVFGQATGAINGRVVDQADAVLPGATINLRNTETGATRSTVTNEQGVYSMPALERGSYQLAVELAGFATTTKNVELIAGSTVT